MAQGGSERGRSRPKRTKKKWQPPPHEAARLTRAGEQVQPVRAEVREFAQALMLKLFGPQGPAWGTKFADIESLCSVLGKELACGLASEVMAAQAETAVPEERARCPTCHAPTAGVGHESRSVQMLEGFVEWQEPEHTCEQCRKAFFPSEPGFGPRVGPGQSGVSTPARQIGG